MSPNVVKKIEERAQEFKLDIRQLQREVKSWEKEIRLQELDKLSKDCLDNFNNLQMTITKKLKKGTKPRKEFDLECYKDTYELLSYVDNKVDAVTFKFLDKKAKNFINLLNAYGQYCSKIEHEYNIELPSEALLKQ